jgi:hypothetical protein
LSNNDGIAQKKETRNKTDEVKMRDCNKEEKKKQSEDEAEQRDVNQGRSNKETYNDDRRLLDDDDRGLGRDVLNGRTGLALLHVHRLRCCGCGGGVRGRRRGRRGRGRSRRGRGGGRRVSLARDFVEFTSQTDFWGRGKEGKT